MHGEVDALPCEYMRARWARGYIPSSVHVSSRPASTVETHINGAEAHAACSSVPHAPAHPVRAPARLEVHRAPKVDEGEYDSWLQSASACRDVPNGAESAKSAVFQSKPEIL